MKKTIFEEMGGTYIRQGDYLIPCLTLPEEEKQRFSLSQRGNGSHQPERAGTNCSGSFCVEKSWRRIGSQESYLETLRGGAFYRCGLSLPSPEG